MKAYAIKNKEGKYKIEDIEAEMTPCFLKDIHRAEIFTEEKVAKCYCPNDCEPVKITIAEGDLEQELNKYKSLYIENEKVVDYQHDKLSEKDKEIEELKTRVAELQDKDWYEACIKQLEDQNDKLIKERDEIQKELETSVDYWKNEVFKKIEVKVAELPKEKIQEIREQVCDEIKELAHNYMEMPICVCCGESFDDIMIKTYNLKEILDQIKKEKKNDNHL